MSSFISSAESVLKHSWQTVYRSRSDSFRRSNLILVHVVLFLYLNNSKILSRYKFAADDISRRYFPMHIFLANSFAFLLQPLIYIPFIIKKKTWAQTKKK